MSPSPVSTYTAISPARSAVTRSASISALQNSVRSLGNNQLLRSNGLGQGVNASTQSVLNAAYGRLSDYVNRTGNDGVRSFLSSYLQSTTVNATALGTHVDTSA
jgi:hypothetical protein